MKTTVIDQVKSIAKMDDRHVPVGTVFYGDFAGYHGPFMKIYGGGLVLLENGRFTWSPSTELGQRVYENYRAATEMEIILR